MAEQPQTAGAQAGGAGGGRGEEIGLAAVIGQVRAELEEAARELAARQDGTGAQPLAFAVDRVSLEFTVQVHREGSAKGGIRIGVVTAELGGRLDRETVHRVSVELQPARDDFRVGTRPLQ